jgi:hypothetical protein
MASATSGVIAREEDAHPFQGAIFAWFVNPVVRVKKHTRTTG